MRVSRSHLLPSALILSASGLVFGLSSGLALAQGAAPATGALATPTAGDVRSWTTFKGDAQRTGSSTADVKLPLSLQWRFSSDAPARSYQVSPLVIGPPGRKRAVFGAGKNVYGLDTQTGEQVWKSPDFTSNIVTPVTLLSGDAGDLIIVGQQGGRLAALRASDGGRVWEVDALASIANAGPVIAQTDGGQRIIVAVTSGRLKAFNLDGTVDPKWEVPLGRYGVSPTTSMTLSNDGTLLFICASDAKLYAIDVRKGTLAYSITLAANSSVTPIVAGEQVITSNVRAVSAFKAQGGSEQWTFNPLGEIIGSPSIGRDATGKTVVYFGTRNGAFFAIDTTGKQIWKTDVGEGFTGSPLVLPSMVVCGTSNGLLIGFDPATGSIVWQYRLKTERITQIQSSTPAGGRGRRRGGFGTRGTTTQNRIWGVSSSPTAVDGQLLLLGDNAALYSFTSNSFDAAPPRVVEPSLAVPDDQNQISPLNLTSSSLQIPGRGPVYFAAQLDDTGSGVDTKSLKVLMDDVTLPPAAIDFQVSSGVLTATLLDPKTGGTGFPDGLRNVVLTAKDYAGNTLQYSFSFLVDNTASAPRARRAITPDPNAIPDDGGEGGDGEGNGAGGENGDGNGEGDQAAPENNDQNGEANPFVPGGP